MIRSSSLRRAHKDSSRDKRDSRASREANKLSSKRRRGNNPVSNHHNPVSNHRAKVRQRHRVVSLSADNPVVASHRDSGSVLGCVRIQHPRRSVNKAKGLNATKFPEVRTPQINSPKAVDESARCGVTFENGRTRCGTSKRWSATPGFAHRRGRFVTEPGKCGST